MPPKGIIFSISGYELTRQESEFFSETNPLGFVLFTRNFKHKEQLKKLIINLKSVTKNKTVLIFVDQEGGRVQRFSGNGFSKFPSQSTFGDIYNKNEELSKELSYLMSYLLATELRNVGVNVNFSPVCDLYFEYADSVIGDRAFHSNPNVVSNLTKEYCKGLRDGGIIPVLKHFPGHGRSLQDTHKQTSIINLNYKELELTDLVPFQNLKNQSLLMLAHIIYPKIDKLVATYSKKINRIIREKFVFNGLIITDDISMNALNDKIEIVTINSSNAGCDVILYCSGILDEMIRIYPLTKNLKKLYYQYFKDDMLKNKPVLRNISKATDVLSSHGLLKE